jgi:hypothetical protein
MIQSDANTIFIFLCTTIIRMLVAPHAALGLFALIAALFSYRYWANNTKKNTKCPTPAEAKENIQMWLNKEANRAALKKMVATKIHTLAAELESNVRECLLTHHLPAFLDAHLITLLKDLEKIPICDTIDSAKMMPEISHYESIWVDQVYNLLLHRCRCQQFDGHLDLAIMPYGDDDSADSSREMSLLDYNEHTNPLNKCVRQRYMKEVYDI